MITINYDYAIAFVYPDPETEIGQSDSLVVNVTANGTPLTWAVSGTGFSLEHAETAGTGNVLHSDGSACGAATITITDCDGNQATGYVRCTAGVWSALVVGCVLTGAWDTKHGATLFSLTKGKYIQWQKISPTIDAGHNCSESPCPDVCAIFGNFLTNCLTFTCADYGWAEPACDDYCCGAPCDSGVTAKCMCTEYVKYSEWICN